MTRRLTIEGMQAIAAARGGRCLSTHYVNNHTPLEWACTEGHRWSAIASNVKKGVWCPACAVQERRRPLAEVQRAAQARGGRCLSTEYINALTPAVAVPAGARLDHDGGECTQGALVSAVREP